MGKRILVLSDMSWEGSGYLSIVSSFAEGLQSVGNDVKVIGLGYGRQEHRFGFGLIPCDNLPDARSMINNLDKLWKFDVLIVALDIPHQVLLLNEFMQRKWKYIVVSPMENGPLRDDWVVGLYPADHIFFMSKMGKDEAILAGLPENKVSHLVIGINSYRWSPMTDREINDIRTSMGITDNMLVVLTVAFNQERKNLWAGVETVGKLKRMGYNVKYILVTQEKSSVGWHIPSLAISSGLNYGSELIVYERGLPVERLRELYCSADVYLQPSKAEGFCMPVVEAMACGTLVVATDTGAMTEHLSGGRGVLVDYDYESIDPFGNSRRHFMSAEIAAHWINNLWSELPEKRENMIRAAREYAESLTQIGTVNQLNEKVEELCNK